MLKSRDHPQSATLKRNLWYRYGLSIVTVGGASWFKWFLFVSLNHSVSDFMLYYPVVMISTWYGRLGPGIFATLLSVLVECLFFEAHYGLRLHDPHYLFNLVFFVGISGVICFLTDNLHRSVLENQAKTQELWRSQGRITNILESVQGCFFSLDEHGNFTHINQGCYRYFSYLTEDLQEKNFWDFFGRWKASAFEEALKQVTQSGKALQFEFFDEDLKRWHEIHIAPSGVGISIHLNDITARKRAENELSDSENRFRIMADQAPVLLWMTGTDTLANYFNEPWLQFRGRSLEQELGNAWTEGIHPEDFELRMGAYLKAFAAQQRFGVEYRLKRSDGRYRWVLDHGVPRVTADKKFAGYIGSVIDIHQRKQEERYQSTEYRIIQILAKKLSLHATFFEVMEVVCEELGWSLGLFWEVDKVLGRLRCKEVVSRGRVKAEEFIEKSRQLLLPIDTGLPGKIWTQGKPIWIEDLGKEVGLPRAFLAQQSELNSGFGFPVCLGKEVYGVFEFYHEQIPRPEAELIDLVESLGNKVGQYVERKLTEEKLNQSQQNFNLALESAQMGYWSWDLQSNHLSWSENLAFLHGLTNPSLGATFEAILSCIHPEDRPMVQDAILAAIQSKGKYGVEFRAQWADGSVHWIGGRGQVYCDENGMPLQLLGFGMDISERKRAEENLMLAYDEMEQRVAQRTTQLASVNENLREEIVERRRVEKELLEVSEKEQRRWGAQIHDDLCQSLTGIVMLTKVLTQKLERKNIGEASDLGQIGGLLQQTLTQARDMARGFYPVELEANSFMIDLQDLAERTSKLFQVRCEFHCPTRILIEDNTLATNLYRITQEAIHNAVKHGQAKFIEISLVHDQDRTVLCIQDDGRGMATGDFNGNAGIGMHIIKYRARTIDAALEIKAREPHGTILICSFSQPPRDEEPQTLIFLGSPRPS